MALAQDLATRFTALSRQSAARQLSLLVGLAASIALGIGLVQWGTTPEFTPVFGDMSPASTSEVLRTLDSAGIKYELNNRSGTVGVDASRVHEARLLLASEGLPESQGSGFATLYKEQEMGISSFIEKARFDRALEVELARSIASLDSVKSARVHLAVPKQSAFVRKASSPAASVLLSLYSGRDLTDRQLAGIAFLVASSVPGLNADNVSVVDNQGKLLSAQGSKDGLAYTKEQFRYTHQLENSYIGRINEILSPILGPSAFRAQVTADLDYTMTERTTESYDPESSIRSEQLTEELTQSEAVGGVPGTLSNEPPPETTSSSLPGGAPADGEQAAPPPTRSSKREIRNYELDKTISHVKEVPGTLNKLSIAVVVDYRDGVDAEGKAERQPLSEQQLQEIESLVREAVGFSEARGDTVNVVSASFVSAPQLEPLPEPGFLQQPWVWRVAKIALAGIGLLIVIFTVLRPLMQASAHQPAAPMLAGSSNRGLPPGGDQNEASLALGEDQVTLGQQQQLGLPGGAPAYEQQLNMARGMVANEPERVAHVVKGWVAADG